MVSFSRIRRRQQIFVGLKFKRKTSSRHKVELHSNIHCQVSRAKPYRANKWCETSSKITQVNFEKFHIILLVNLAETKSLLEEKKTANTRRIWDLKSGPDWTSWVKIFQFYIFNRMKAKSGALLDVHRSEWNYHQTLVMKFGAYKLGPALSVFGIEISTSSRCLEEEWNHSREEVNNTKRRNEGLFQMLCLKGA